MRGSGSLFLEIKKQCINSLSLHILVTNGDLKTECVRSESNETEISDQISDFNYHTSCVCGSGLVLDGAGKAAGGECGTCQCCGR